MADQQVKVVLRGQDDGFSAVLAKAADLQQKALKQVATDATATSRILRDEVAAVGRLLEAEASATASAGKTQAAARDKNTRDSQKAIAQRYKDEQAGFARIEELTAGYYDRLEGLRAAEAARAITAQQTLDSALEKRRSADTERRIKAAEERLAQRKREYAAEEAAARQHFAKLQGDTASAIAQQYRTEQAGFTRVEELTAAYYAKLDSLRKSDIERQRAAAVAQETLDEAVARRRTAGLESRIAAAEARMAQRRAAAGGGSGGGGGAGEFGSGVGAALGVGFGATPVGAGIATALAVVGSSRAALELERTNAALVAVTGSTAQAAEGLDFIKRTADRLGLSVRDLTNSYAPFIAASKGTALEGGKTRDIFLAVTEAGARLHLNNEQVQGSLNAIAQIMSKGTVQAEELRGQLGDRLPGAFNIMARALGVTTAQLGEMLKNGQVLADDALPKFAAELRKTFDTDVNSRIETTSANFARLGNEIRLSAAAFGAFINRTAGPAAGGLAAALRDARDGGLTAPDGSRKLLINGRYISEDIVNGTPAFSPALYDPSRTMSPFFGPGTPLQFTGTGGLDLLTSGQAPYDIKEGRASRRRIAQARAAAASPDGQISNLEKFNALQEDGAFAGKNSTNIEELRQEAIALDEVAAKRKANQQQKKADRAEDRADAKQQREENEALDRDLADYAKRLKQIAEDKKANEQRLDKFDLRGRDAVAQIQDETRALSQNSLQRKIAAEQTRVQYELEQQLLQLRGDDPEAESRFLRSAAEQKSSIADALTAQYEAQRDGALGAKNALRDLADSATNSADQAAQAINSGFSAATNAVVRFAETGKFSFRSFASSIISDLLRIAAQRAVGGILQSIVGAFAGGVSGSPFGGVTGPGYASGLLGAGGIGGSLVGRAAGGYAGSPVEVGEGNRPEIYAANGRTYLIPGNKGGVVTPTTGGSVGSSAMSVTINVDARQAQDPNATQQAVRAGVQLALAKVTKNNGRGLAARD